MDTISNDYVVRAEFWLMITTLIYFLMNGAQIFETALIVPKWTSDPPRSFNLFNDGYGNNLKIFWIIVHSIHEVTFILAIVFCWKFPEVRYWLCFLFTIHFAVRVWTILYFAPNIIGFQKISNKERDYNMLKKVELWKKLNYCRVGIFIAVSLGLLPLIEIVRSAF